MFKLSGVQAPLKEEVINHYAILTVTLTGLIQPATNIQWLKPDGSAITGGVEGYTITIGRLNGATQVTMLDIPEVLNTGDAVYTCRVSSVEHGVENRDIAVSLNVLTCPDCQVGCATSQLQAPNIMNVLSF